MFASLSAAGSQRSEQRSLATFISWSVWAFAALGALALGWSLLRASAVFALIGVASLAASGVWAWAHAELRRGHSGRAVIKVSLSGLGLSIVAILIAPSALPVLSIVPPAAVALALQHLGARTLRQLMLAALATTALLVLLAERVALFPGVYTLGGLPLLVGSVAEVALMLWHLWRYRARLGALLSEARSANLALQQSQEGLEHEVRQRTAELTDRVAELQEHTRELSLMGEMNDLIRACESPDEAYTVISSSMSDLFSGDSGVLAVADASQPMLKVLASWGQPLGAESFAAERCQALQSGRPYHHAPGASQPCAHLSNPQISSFCMPLMSRGETLGVLTVGHTAAGDLAERKRRLAATIARQLELALANLRLQERLREQSIRDALTGLFNRRYMEETLEREVSRARRAGQTIGVIMFDIDHFKRFNDSFGHIAGDLLLRETGSFLQQHIRSGDIACRYGGEEFTIIMPDTSEAAIGQRAESLRQGIKQIDLHYLGQPLGQVTISAGIALMPTHSLTASGVLAQADAALYRAKRSGRDCVVLAEAA